MVREAEITQWTGVKTPSGWIDVGGYDVKGNHIMIYDQSMTRERALLIENGRRRMIGMDSKKESLDDTMKRMGFVQCRHYYERGFIRLSLDGSKIWHSCSKVKTTVCNLKESVNYFSQL